jgi:hypothetical protein
MILNMLMYSRQSHFRCAKCLVDDGPLLPQLAAGVDAKRTSARDGLICGLHDASPLI